MFKISERKPLCKAAQSQPLCEELREFIVESRKCQTLYANCEGVYDRRIIQCEEDEILSCFVANTMFNEVQQHNLDSRQIFVVKKISETIKKQNQVYCRNEIHLGAVWVYFFDREKKTTNSVPVFKVYASHGNSVQYIDIQGKIFHSWDFYIDTAPFSESFVCFPRHGSYSTVHGEKAIDLEYVSLQSSYPYIKYSLPVSPFSQSAIRPWIKKISTKFSRIFAMVREKLSQFLSFCDTINPGTVIFIIACIIQRAESNDLKALTPSNWKDGLYMLNDLCVSYSRGLSFDHLIRTLPFKCNIPNFGSFLEVDRHLSKVQEVFASVKEAFTNPSSSNFDKFAKTFLFFSEVFSWLWPFLKLLISSALVNTIGGKIFTICTIANCFIPKLIDTTSSTKSLLENVAPEFKKLETDFDQISFRELCEKISNKEKTKEKLVEINESKPVLLAKGKDFLYLFPDSFTDFDLITSIQQMTGNCVVLKQKIGDHYIEVLDPSFKTLGKLFVVQEQGTLGCFNGDCILKEFQS